jgi:hypothetical protein
MLKRFGLYKEKAAKLLLKRGQFKKEGDKELEL